jgi:hypothetical protein
MQMKELWKVMTIVTGIALLVGACATAAPAPTTAPVVDIPSMAPVTEEPDAPLVPAAAQDVTIELPLVAKKVTEMPKIDGDVSDAAWKDAKLLKVGVLNMKSVYDGEDIAFQMVWADRDLSINSRGTWNWDEASQIWSQTGMEEGTWESFRGKRHPEWVNVAFDISSVVSAEGCFAFCHEYPAGSGIFHHNTIGAGQYVDSWGLLAKHGYGSKTLEDMGWTLGYTDVVQNGEVAFDAADPIDPRQLLNGDVTFVGYAEDKIIAPLEDTKYPTTTRPADTYCIDCHQDKGAPEWTKTGNTTYGDDGELPYHPNWNEDYSQPIYMETAPTDFADSMVLTQSEVDAGDAVAVADLTPEQVAEYWANYTALNGVVPHLVLQQPTDSQADVLTAANWKNGVWTAEFTRKMVNGAFDDVQFDDLNKEYSFGISLWNHTDLLAPLMRFVPGTLTFEQ